MSAKKGSSGKKMEPPEGGVIVRMYNTGFGDCFLLAFRAEGDDARYVLIDCGVHDRYEGGREKTEKVARDIAESTDNRLDVIAVTHEHTDHLYGFKYGESVFSKMKEIGTLWLAWTEDPDNTLARELEKIKESREKALVAAIKQMKEQGSPLAARFENVLAFDMEGDFSLGIHGNKDILKALRSWSIKKLERSEDYRRPGEAPLTLPGVKGVRCYVLGPPENKELIRKLVDKDEMYLESPAIDEEVALINALMAGEKRGDLVEDPVFRSYPFDQALKITADEAGAHKKYGHFFKKMYGFTDHENNGPGWRRIDSDWMAVADNLALKINRMTNNTSLVLAFELMDADPPKVLLFTGDAQVGNWLSWQSQIWPEQRVTGADLIKRTVLYKVGHHGSRNATLREKGLEMMENRDLVAMIPVDEEWANKRGWHHPETPLVNRLMEKARGRVLRSDRIPGKEPLEKPAEASDTEWNAFQSSLDWDRSPDKLWIQYTIT